MKITAGGRFPGGWRLAHRGFDQMDLVLPHLFGTEIPTGVFSVGVNVRIMNLIAVLTSLLFFCSLVLEAASDLMKARL